MDLTVVIPFGGTSTFRLLLESLVLQSVDWNTVEILVAVREQSTSSSLLAEAREAIRPYERFLPLRTALVAVNANGHQAAALRNRGAALSAALRLAFVDSDCLLHQNAIECHRTGRGVHFGAIRELPARHRPLLQTHGGRDFSRLWDLSLEDYRATDVVGRAADWRDCYSGNLSLDRSLFEDVCGFDETGARCHDVDLGYRLAQLGPAFTYDDNCRAIHIEHPRSVGYRLEQNAGWKRLAAKHQELASHAADHSLATRASIARLIGGARDELTRRVCELPGSMCATVFVTAVNTPPERVLKCVEDLPHDTTEWEGGVEFKLRLHRDCWDFSILIPQLSLNAQPAFTVVIPAYNAESTIGRALESVLAQTFTSLEVLVVDDASRDGTLAAAGRYVKDGRVRVVTSRRNKGLAHSLNSGLLAARGEFVLQLDADDWLERDSLASVRQRVDSDEIIAAYGDPRVHRRSGVCATMGSQVHAGREHFSYGQIQAPRVYRKDVLKALNGWSTNDPYDGRYYEDRLTLARVADRGVVKHVCSAGYNVMEHQDSLARRCPLTSAAAKLAVASAEAARRREKLTWSFDGSFLSVTIGKFVAPAEPERSWSIIVPHLDREKYLVHTLRSWVESDLPPGAEILIVDYGSNSSEAETLASMDTRIRVLRCKANSAGAARNFGARHARGDLLFFCDADHVVAPTICRVHENWHRDYTPAVVCGNIGSRRVFTSTDPALPSWRRQQLAALVRMRSDAQTIAGHLLRAESVALFSATGPVWDAAQPFTCFDDWARGWWELLLELGVTMAGYPHRWLRLASGIFSIPAESFARLGGFAEELASKEDWELGLRAQDVGLEILGAPDSQALHQIHPQNTTRALADLAGIAYLRDHHSRPIAALERTRETYRPPGAASLLQTLGVAERDESACAAEENAQFLALTFDDGPHSTGTNVILDALDMADAAGTFFLLGERLSECKDVLRRLKAGQHELALHGWRHTHPARLSPNETVDQIRNTFKEVADITGVRPRFFRPPYGILTRTMVDVCRELELTIAGWHVSADDWSGGPMVDLLPPLTQRQPGGTVYLFHDGTGDPLETAAAVSWLLRQTRDCWSPVTLSEYVAQRPMPSLVVQDADPLSDWANWPVADLIHLGRV